MLITQVSLHLTSFVSDSGIALSLCPPSLALLTFVFILLIKLLKFRFISRASYLTQVFGLLGMSLQSTTATPDKGRLFSVKLSCAADYPQWRSALRDYAFSKLTPSLDSLRQGDTLDPAYFKAHSAYKTEFKEATSAGDSDDPFVNSAVLSDKCFKHAMSTPSALAAWVPNMFASIRCSLSDKIKKQTAGVQLGDIVSLLKTIKLSILHFEVFDPTDLEVQYSNCVMEIAISITQLLYWTSRSVGSNTSKWRIDNLMVLRRLTMSPSCTPAVCFLILSLSEQRMDANIFGTHAARALGVDMACLKHLSDRTAELTNGSSESPALVASLNSVL